MKILSVTLTTVICFVLIGAVNRCSFPAMENVSVAVADSVEVALTLESTQIGVSTVASGLDVPWDLAWGPDNNIIFSEQGGRVSQLNTKTGTTKVLLVIPEVWRKRTSGLLGLALPPDIKASPYVILDYTIQRDSMVISKLVRYTYAGDTLTQPLTLLEVQGSTSHNGSRITVSADGKIFWATGDGMRSKQAQDTSFLNGKILRINMDGSIPADNPVAGSAVWAWGYRNMQGLTFGKHGNLYTSEHGEASDDEVNLIEKGANYGWPDVEGFCNTASEKAYCSTHNITEPLKAWTPTIAPAGIEYYDHPSIPEWQNAIILTTLKDSDLRILKLNSAGTAVVEEKIYFDGQFGRLRDVCVSPSGDIYVSTSNRDWNPGPGFPQQRDDRILKISAITSGTKLPAKTAVKKDTASKSKVAASPGSVLYNQYCASCHKPDGKGIKGTFPPLAKSAAVTGDKKSLINIVLHGRTGNVVINGTTYDQPMPAFSFLSDQQLADIVTYIRTDLGNKNSAVTGKEVAKERK